MEQWSRWIPHENIQGQLFLTKTITVENNTFIYGELILKNTNDTFKYLKFEYNDVLGYRETDEGNRLATFEYLSDKYGTEFYGPWDFFEVENSDYINEFIEGSDMFNQELTNSLEHHVFLGEEVIDIICTKKPKVTISNSFLI